MTHAEKQSIKTKIFDLQKEIDYLMCELYEDDELFADGVNEAIKERGGV